MTVDRMLTYDEVRAAGLDPDSAPRGTAGADSSVPPSQPQRSDLRKEDGTLGTDGWTGPDPALADLLDQVDAFLSGYVAFPSTQARHAVVLWIVHSWTLDAFESTPRLHVKSAEKGSGKTRLLECIELLVWNPLAAANCTTAALFRSIGDNQPPTVILDEIDTIFGPKAPDGSEDLRGLINAGHRRGKPILRCTGPNHDVHEFASFCAMALAGIGDIPDTIADRAIEIRMRRRAPEEKVKAFRHREAEAEAAPLRSALAGMADELVEQMTDHYPTLPSWLADRPADVWEPVIAIGEQAGPPWHARAVDAASVLLSEKAEDQSTLGTRLLAEIQMVMGDDTAVTTEILTARLHALEESPWGEWNVSARWLSQHLKPYGIRSKNVRVNGVQAKGYDRECFADAWSRYLAVPPSQASQAPEQGIPQNGSVPAPSQASQTWANGEPLHDDRLFGEEVDG